MSLGLVLGHRCVVVRFRHGGPGCTWDGEVEGDEVPTRSRQELDPVSRAASEAGPVRRKKINYRRSNFFESQYIRDFYCHF